MKQLTDHVDLRGNLDQTQTKHPRHDGNLRRSEPRR